ncbi:MAG: hypothetical protein ACRDK8_15955, partial [Solirubrobacteraceae bacterium]
MSADSCELCSGPLESALAAHDRNRSVSSALFDYQRCRACGTLQLSAPPEDIDRYYPPSYYGFPADRDALLAASTPERYKLDLISRYATSDRLLEIG